MMRELADNIMDIAQNSISAGASLTEAHIRVSHADDRITFIFKDDGWGELGGGFVKGKHELYPFPFDVIELNRWDEATGTGLKQNPGWE